MGPYMRPIPVGASAAMVFSLVVAFVVTPWAAVRLLKPNGGGACPRGTRGLLHPPLPPRHGARCCTERRCAGASWRWSLLLLLGSMLAGLRRVRQGEDAALRQQERVPGDRRHARRHHARDDRAVTRELADAVLAPSPRWSTSRPTWARRRRTTSTAWCGTTTCGGLERRRHSGEPARRKHERATAQSHDIAKRVRERLTPIAGRYGARVKVAEVPPGPPVLQTLVAEIYGPDAGGPDQAGPSDQGDLREDRRRGGRRLVRRGRPAQVHALIVDKEKAALNGISEDDIARTMRIASAGESAGLLHIDAEKEDVPITLRLDRATRSDLDRMQNLKVRAARANWCRSANCARRELRSRTRASITRT